MESEATKRWRQSEAGKKWIAEARAAGVFKKYSKKYNASAKGKASIRRSTDVLNASGIRPAHKAVQKAVKSGKLIRLNICMMCFRHTKTSFHHYSGYNREHWLTVIELCDFCHKQEHGCPQLTNTNVPNVPLALI